MVGAGPSFAILLLLGVGLLASTAGAPGACEPENLVELRSFLAALPSAELVALAELVEAQPSTGAPDAAALVEELTCIVGDRRELLWHALAELGHQRPAQPKRRTEDGGQRIRGPGGGGTVRPFIYLLLIGGDSRLRGVSTALLCLLLQGLAVGPSPWTDAGVATCHRFERYCQSWLHYYPGTRVEVWTGGSMGPGGMTVDDVVPSQWQSGTVLRSNVHRRNGIHELGRYTGTFYEAGRLAGTMTVAMDDGEDVDLQMPGHIVRQLVDETGGDVLVRFWDWSRHDQIHFFEHELVGADFVLNPVGLGRDVLAPGTHIAGEGVVGGGGGELVYITVLRNPLDAVVARFFAADDRDLSQARVARDIKALAGLPLCPFALAGAACWDADYYTQSLSDPALCVGAARREAGEVCSDEAEEEALRRVGSMQVVLMEDWLHLSGPLLCQKLGASWCDERRWASLRHTTRSPSAVCGITDTLRLGGGAGGGDDIGGDWARRLYRALAGRNQRDLRLFAAARARARHLLEAAGVAVPDEAGPAAEERGRAAGDCAAAAKQQGEVREGTVHGESAWVTIGGARAHLPVWMRCHLASAECGDDTGRRCADGAGRGWQLVPAKTWPEREADEGGRVEDEARQVAGRMEGLSLEKWSSSQHGEEVYAVETFFWGRTRGSFLELGAVDGELFSNTLGVFERILAWRGILIEASPQSFEILPHKRPNQISVHAAICGEARDVHWADSTVSRLDYARAHTHTYTHTTAGEYPRPHPCNVCATDENKDN
jgi:hypothetical protein